MTADQIARALGGQPSGSGWVAHCPAHDDQKSSLSISQNNGKVLLHCHAGCSQEAVIAALKARGLWGGNGEGPSHIVKEYDYVDENGTLLYQSVRFEPKDFRQRRPDGNGGWEWSLKGTRRVLYRLPEVIQAVSKGQPVFIVEGEKDVERLRSEFLFATCNAGGAQKWRDEYSENLRGAKVVVIADNDPPGRKHVQQVAGSLVKVGAKVKVIDLPGLPDKGDVSDWLVGHTREDLLQVVKETPVWEPAEEGESETLEEDPVLRLKSGGELEDAERFKAFYGDRVLWCSDKNSWYIWDRRRWGRDDREYILYFAQKMVRNMYRVGGEIDEKTCRIRYIDHARKLEQITRLRHIIEMVKPMVAVTPERFDRNPHLCNCKNGTIDLNTGELRKHRKEDMITMIAPVNYSPDAVSETWDRFLFRVLPDAEVREFVQRAAGYSLLGEAGEERFFFAYGPPATGKSTFLLALQAALGDYATTADFETFLEKWRPQTGPRPEIVRLVGRRFVVSLEVTEGRKLAESLVSQLVGQDMVSARGLYQNNSVEFLPSFTLWLAANNRPRVSDNNSPVWRRILQLPFEQVISENERDLKIKRVLRNPEVSGPAVLNWMVKGCLAYQEKGLQVPGTVREKTEEYRQESDPLKDFVDECCVIGENQMVAKGALYEKYCQWHEASGESKKTKMSKKSLGTHLRMQYDDFRHPDISRERYWLGIGLK
jgi:putative DNA primase/helicase